MPQNNKNPIKTSMNIYLSIKTKYIAGWREKKSILLICLNRRPLTKRAVSGPPCPSYTPTKVPRGLPSIELMGPDSTWHWSSNKLFAWTTAIEKSPSECLPKSLNHNKPSERPLASPEFSPSIDGLQQGDTIRLIVADTMPYNITSPTQLINKYIIK